MKSTAIFGVATGGQRVLHALPEEDAVGQTRERVVEGLVLELLLEADAFADVARGEHQAAHVRVVEQVGDHGLGEVPAALVVAQPPLAAQALVGPSGAAAHQREHGLTSSGWTRSLRRFCSRSPAS